MRGRLRAALKRKITLMVINHDGSKVRQVNLSQLTVSLLILLMAGSFCWSFLVISKNVDYRVGRRELAKARKHLEVLSGELSKHRQSLANTLSLEKQWRKLMALKKGDTVIKFTGLGGPTENDEMQINRWLEENEQQFRRRVEKELDGLAEGASRQGKSFRAIAKRLAKQKSIMEARPCGWPVKGWITSGFGMRVHPIKKSTRPHIGIDIANETGTPIRATAPGLVTLAGWTKGYGRVVIIDHGYGWSTRYGHLKSFRTRVGRRVERGEVVGQLGDSGESTGPHLQYEVRKHNVPQDPAKYLERKAGL